MTYHDFRFKFTDLPRALAALQALRDAGVLDPEGRPRNMLGDPCDPSGTYTPDPSAAAWAGRKGTPAATFTDPDGSQVSVPARGDPACWYIHIRSTVDSSTLPIDPADYGMTPTDPAESAAVLGVWA